MRVVSQAAARAAMEKSESAKVLSVLLSACQVAWNVRTALPTVEEVWESLVNRNQGAWNREQLQDCANRLMEASAYPLCRKGSQQNRAMLLKGYGNAINPYVAAEFVRACMDTLE
jgi:hypothetical protein